MKNHLVLIKLGGSLITDKKTPLTARPEPMQLFAAELAKARTANPDVDFIIGNGAGSFGHFTAHEYGLRQGAATPKQFYGMALTHNNVVRLNLLVADALTAEDIPAFPLSPASMLTCSNGQLSSTHLTPLTRLLANNCVPLVYGDTISDDQLGTHILSTEKILDACLDALRGDYNTVTVLYLLDVAGVLDADGAAIPQLQASDDIFMRANLAHDVTGGIVGKVQSARKAAQTADAVYLADGHKTGALQQAIAGSNPGTRILSDAA
jgi:isopentenyl phosphate kinase